MFGQHFLEEKVGFCRILELSSNRGRGIVNMHEPNLTCRGFIEDEEVIDNFHFFELKS